MSSINNVRNLQILYFSKKNKEIKNLKIEKKKWLDIGSYPYHSQIVQIELLINSTTKNFQI